MAWRVRVTPADGASGISCARSPSLGRIVALGNRWDPAIVYSDDDGVTWAAADPNALDLQFAGGVCWAAFLNLFVAVGTTTTAKAIIITSSDGITWATQTHPWDAVLSELHGIDSDETNSLLVAVGRRQSNGFIYLDSSDATAWVEHDIAPLSTAQAVKRLPNISRWVVVGVPDALAEAICTSPDTTVWTGVASGFDQGLAASVGQLNNGNIVVGGAGIAGESLVQSSDGGVSFVTKVTPFDGGTINGIGVGSDVVYLGGVDVTGKRVLATSVNDGATYAFETHPFDSAGGGGQLTSFVLSGTTWVSVGQNDAVTEMVATSRGLSRQPVYQRIYGIPVEIDDNGVETVRELIVGIVGAP